jgi:hypothetical protein
MKRRNFLKIASSSVAIPFFPRLTGNVENVNSGWVPPKKDFNIKEFPEQVAPKKEAILLHKFLEAATKRVFIPHNQETVDCTSHATGLSIDIAQAIQVCLGQDRWVREIATELLHIGSREIIGGRYRGGVAISEAVKFATDFGNLYRLRYSDWDFTTYSLDNIRKVDRKTEKELKLLLDEAGYHPILDSYKVSNAEQACLALSSLHPVVLGSNTAFGKTRDKDGFVRPSRGTWSHAWSLIGFDTRFHRPGALLMSSWGKNWVKGPKRNQPDGSIWVDMKVLDRMMGEAIAIETFLGLPR